MDDLRLFTPLDIVALVPRHPVADAALWVAYMRPLQPCLLCEQPVAGRVAYVAILTPGDGDQPPWSTSICRACGEADDRTGIERRAVEMTALHAYTAGNA